MTEPSEPYRRDFDALRRRFLAEVPEKIRAIREAVECTERGSHPREEMEALCQLAHRLVGSAAIFGLERLSASARTLEDRLAALLKAAQGPGSAGAEPELMGLVEELERAWSRNSMRKNL